MRPEFEIRADYDPASVTLSDFSPHAGWQTAITLLREHLAAACSTPEYARALGLTRGVGGYAFHTVPVALYAWLRYPRDFAAALTSVLDCGGDTDTTGAITGALAGTALGAAAIPVKWRSRLCDWPLSAAKLESAASALAANTLPPRLFWSARLLRNPVFLLVVLAHGFRRLLPPY